MPNKIVLIAALVVTCVTIIAYQPAYRIQFYDGWWYLEWAATMDVPRYAIQFLDPANITQGYRPVQGLYMFILYRLFGFNPDGYHLAHTLLHSANAILLWLVVTRIGACAIGSACAFRVGVIAALAYAVSPVITLAVFWHAVVDPLSAFFYLLTILLWARYIKTRAPRDWVFAFVAYLFALFSKEVAVFLAPILFLIEWWVFRQKINLAQTAQRYALFLIVIIPYLFLVVSVQSHGEFSSQFGFKIGPHMLANLVPYLAVLTLPWTDAMPTERFYFAWLALIVVAYLSVALYKRSWVGLLIGLVALLNISPLTGFPLDYFNTRYLYLSLMSTAIIAALAFDSIARRFVPRRAFTMIAALVVAGVVLASSARVADAAATLAEYTRQVRVPFRDISRTHPTFPDDTYLYFIYSPMTTVWDFKGLFFVRYGKHVQVEATDSGALPELHAHAQSYIYYFDADGKPIELPVEKNIATRVAPTLPAQFGDTITLDSLDVSGVTLARGSALVVFLNWRATARVDTDYTVFANLVNAQGELVAASDAPPRRGEMPTSTWTPHRPVVDVVVMPIDARAPTGINYRLELGLYDAATTKRVPIVDAHGATLADKVVIESFSIAP
ncbi:MAG: glycosyltransferase family 39 protein [Chloroflexi bacterium]|nr:glycosyltransferase family 39 protein [Chloroflexota bacterium]